MIKIFLTTIIISTSVAFGFSLLEANEKIPSEKNSPVTSQDEIDLNATRIIH